MKDCLTLTAVSIITSFFVTWGVIQLLAWYVG
jgi:hypothetical protein